MTVAQQQIPAASAHGFLSYGFRPFFLSAALWAVLGMGLWVAMLLGWLALPSAFDPVSWHAHEALFGYLGAVLAGFLLTAVPSWTGRPPIAGWPLLGLLALWILGRVAVAASQWLAPSAVTLIDISCLLTLGGYVLREIVADRNWRNLVVLAILGVFVAGNALFHREAADGAYAASGYGLRTGLAAAIMMISLIGGRIVPTFTRNWLAARGTGALPAEFGRLDKLALALTALALVLWVARPDAPETGFLLLACGLVQAARLSRWHGWNTVGEPLVLILHVGYAFVPFGMVVMESGDPVAGLLDAGVRPASVDGRSDWSHDPCRDDPRDARPYRPGADGGQGDGGGLSAGRRVGARTVRGRWAARPFDGVVDAVGDSVVQRLCRVRTSLRTNADRPGRAVSGRYKSGVH